MQAPSSLSQILTQITTLHALHRLEADMAWLLTEGVVPLQFAKDVPLQIRWASLRSDICPVPSVALSSCTTHLDDAQHQCKIKLGGKLLFLVHQSNSFGIHEQCRVRVFLEALVHRQAAAALSDLHATSAGIFNLVFLVDAGRCARSSPPAARLLSTPLAFQTTWWPHQ